MCDATLLLKNTAVAEIGWRNAEAGRRVQRLDDSVGPVTFIILNIT